MIFNIIVALLLLITGSIAIYGIAKINKQEPEIESVVKWKNNNEKQINQISNTINNESKIYSAESKELMKALELNGNMEIKPEDFQSAFRSLIQMIYDIRETLNLKESKELIQILKLSNIHLPSSKIELQNGIKSIVDTIHELAKDINDTFEMNEAKELISMLNINMKFSKDGIQNAIKSITKNLKDFKEKLGNGEMFQIPNIKTRKAQIRYLNVEEPNGLFVNGESMMQRLFSLEKRSYIIENILRQMAQTNRIPDSIDMNTPNIEGATPTDSLYSIKNWSDIK